MANMATEYGKRILKAMAHGGFKSQTALATALGIRQPSLSYIINEANESKYNDAIADACGVRAKWLASEDGEMLEQSRATGIRFARKLSSNTRPAIQQEGKVPLISSTKAGEWSEAIDIFEPGYADEWVTRVNGGPNVYALYVDGDSMTAPPGVHPSFPDGYIIHVDPDQEAHNNDCVIAKVKGRPDVTFKQLKNESGVIYLKPLNPLHPPMFEEFKVIGKVVGASIKL